MATHRSALRDITNTSSLNASTLGSNNNSGLKSILVSSKNNGPRESIRSSTTSNTSSILSTSILGGGGSNNQSSNLYINTLVEFFSNENLGIDITMKTFREGDSSKLRFFLNHLFKQLDMNLCVTVPTPSEVRDREKKPSINSSNSNNNNNTTMMIMSSSFSHSNSNSKHSSLIGIDEELVMQLVEYFKIPIQLNKRHFGIAPQSNRNWQTMLQLMFHLVCIVKHSRNLNAISEHQFSQELIFFNFLSNLYRPFLDSDQTSTNTIINEWKSKFGNDSQRCKSEVIEIEQILKSVQDELQYFNTRKEPFIELEEKRISLENDYQHLSVSINNFEQGISKLLNDLKLKKTELSTLQSQSENRKRENEIYQKQLELQTITPLEVQNINREKAILEEEDLRLTKQLEYTREQLEIVKRQLIQYNENSTILINQYNNTVLRIDQSLLLTYNSSSNMNGSGMNGFNGFNRWRINDAKQKKTILKTQLSSVQTQIQQAQEISIERDHLILEMEHIVQDQQELEASLNESYAKLEEIYSQMKQHHTEELLQIEKRIKATEEFSQRIHNEKVELRHQLDQNELIIAQLEETIAKEEAYFIQKRNACMNIRIDATHIVADHKQHFDVILNNCEKSQKDTFEYIKEIAQFTTSEMQKCINNSISQQQH